jgi:hypothetical protein
MPKWKELITLPEHILIEDWETSDGCGITRKSELHESTPHIIFHQGLLQVVNNAFDESSGCYSAIQKTSRIHHFLKPSK